MRANIIFLLAAGVTGFLGGMAYLQGSHRSIEQSAHPASLNMLPNPPVKQEAADKLGVQLVSQPVTRNEGLLCVDGIQGCFCSDAYGNKLETPRNQCLEMVYTASGQSYKADAATLGRLRRQQQLVREIEEKRQAQRNASKPSASVYIIPPHQCPQNTRAIPMQNSHIIECVMQ